MFVNPWTFFLLSWTKIQFNSFETLSVTRKSSPFWVHDLQTPKATFTTRYVQTYFTFLLIPPNKWCLPQFTVVQVVIWSGKSLSCSTWQPGKTCKSRTKWSHDPETERFLFFFFTALPPVQMHTLCSDMSAVSMNERLDRKRKKAFRFTTSYTNEAPETQAGAQLFLVGLNFRWANTRGSTAHLLAMAVLVCMNVSQGPSWPDE